jgi:hypothetical protein
MDQIVNRFARELAEAIAAAVDHDPQVEACRAKARAAGFEMRVSLEALVGFVSKANRTGEVNKAIRTGEPRPQVHRPAAVERPLEMSASDRRFLRTLRIAADETREEV